MYKCPKCGYTNDAPGSCPTDNETLVEVQNTDIEHAEESTPAESTPETTTSEEKKA